MPETACVYPHKLCFAFGYTKMVLIETEIQ